MFDNAGNDSPPPPSGAQQLCSDRERSREICRVQITPMNVVKPLDRTRRLLDPIQWHAPHCEMYQITCDSSAGSWKSTYLIGPHPIAEALEPSSV